jgi:hypothetical protein
MRRLYKEDAKYRNHIEKPEEIWYGKNLLKGNQVVQGTVNNGVVRGISALQPREPCHVEGKV